METVKLNGTTIQGGGLKYAITPQIVLGDEKHGNIPGTILDANAVKQIVDSGGSSGESNANLSLRQYNSKSDARFDVLETTKNLSLNVALWAQDGIYGGASYINGVSNILGGRCQAVTGYYNYAAGQCAISGNNNIVSGNTTTPIRITKKEKSAEGLKITLDLHESTSVAKDLLKEKCCVIPNLDYDADKKETFIDVIDSNITRDAKAQIGPDGYIVLTNLALNALYNSNHTHVVIVRNYTIGNFNLSIGTNNLVKCSGSANVGSAIVNTGNTSCCFGHDVDNSAKHSITAGEGLITTNFAAASFGAFNSSTVITGDKTKLPTGEVRKTATLFAIGNGTDADHRSNALEIKYNGDMYLNDGRKVQDVLPQTPAATRPANPVLGQMFFDTVKNKPLWFGKDNKWVDANGTVVA